MITIDDSIQIQDLAQGLEHLFAAAGPKILALSERWGRESGAPVFTAAGKYTSRGWTEWTQGFRIGSALLQFEATGDEQFLELGRDRTIECMGPHVTHTGVHDHGFHNVSTYGNLLRLMSEGVIPDQTWERRFYELAIQSSGAVQAARWAALPEGSGYVYSFNGPQSLFADTIRSMRVLALSDMLGGALLGENDVHVDLFDRVLIHAESTARFNVYFGDGRDAYDVRGRVAHESIFNRNDGAFRCPSTQQGYSPFTTWTRALAWILLGFAEELEFLATAPAPRFEKHGGKDAVLARFEDVARATADYYIESTPTDGIPFWDTGAPGIVPDDLDRPSDPFNDREPVDSSSAAIAAQGLLRLGKYCSDARYTSAGLSVTRSLLSEPYLSRDVGHEGLLLHSVYHRPKNWDYIPEGRKIPCGEATMWGDYHLLELGLLAQRELRGRPWLRFFNVHGENGGRACGS